MNTTKVGRSYPAKPVRVQPVHKNNVVEKETARKMLKKIYHIFKNSIDQETLFDYKENGDNASLTFVIGTRQLSFSYVEGGES